MIYIEHFLAAWFERRREQSGDAGVNANGDITSMYPKSGSIYVWPKGDIYQINVLGVKDFF